MNGKRFSEDKARRNGFYLALAVCLVAVGIAAWSTYDAVHSYVAPQDPDQSSLTQMENEEVRSGQAVSAGQEESMPAGQRASAGRESNASQPVVDEDPEKPRQASGKVTLKTSSGVGGSSKPAATPTPSPEPEIQEEPQVPATAPLYERSSEMIYPLESKEIAKAYSAGAPVYSQTMKDWRIHSGMDVTAQAGEEIRACANGLVKQVYTDNMLGNVIVVEHGDYEFSYCGVNEDFQVQEGEVVTKGQVIGKVTAVPSESADASHLHVEVRRDGACLDPQSVIEGKN